MCLEVKSDYQKSLWFKSLFRVLGPFKGSGGMLPWNILKMEPLRLAKNAFPAYLSYGHEVS